MLARSLEEYVQIGKSPESFPLDAIRDALEFWTRISIAVKHEYPEFAAAIICPFPNAHDIDATPLPEREGVTEPPPLPDNTDPAAGNVVALPSPRGRRTTCSSRIKSERVGGDPRVTKTSMIEKLLIRKKGCTSAEVREATGWTAVSMPAVAKSCGLALRTEKIGNVTRYYGSRK